MKHIKKAVTLFLAFAMVLAMSVSVFAADPTTYTITIKKAESDKAAHTYGAYQLFKGDLAEENGKKVLSNIQWGDNVDSAEVITALNALDGFAIPTNASAKDVAKAIGEKNYSNDSVGAKALADALGGVVSDTPKGTASIAASATSGTISGLPAGYYLVKDDAAVADEGAKTRYILEVVSNVEVTEKGDVPTVDKTVGTEKKNVADYNVGDPVPYTITGTLPSNFADYKTYKTYTFTDTMSAGLTPPAANAVTVMVGEDVITDLFDVAVNGQTITVSLKSGVDLKTATHGAEKTAFTADDQIVVSYSATLNNSAVVGGTGNINTVNLQFSNNPNSNGEGDKGKTPDDKTVVFTYTIEALKVEADGEPITQAQYDALDAEDKADYVKVGDKWQKTKALSGAGFTLYRKNDQGGWVAVGDEITGVTTFTFERVDAGDYKLVETTVPAGYNKCDDILINVAASYTNDEPPQIDKLTVTPASAGFVANKATGVVSGKILNESGSTLPSTGGVGTVIFYTLGSLLVIGCGIVLISRKRTNN